MDRLTYLYCKFYLQDDILTKVDRASMACSLEARAPFLDYTFVEFVNSIPHRFKLKGLTSKYILKRAMQKKLPPAILARRKKGFGIPVAHWLASDLKPLAQEMFSEDRIRRQGLFNPGEVTRLFQEHLAVAKKTIASSSGPSSFSNYGSTVLSEKATAATRSTIRRLSPWRQCRWPRHQNGRSQKCLRKTRL